MKTSSRRVCREGAQVGLTPSPVLSRRPIAAPGLDARERARYASLLGWAASLGFLVRLPLAWGLALAWIIRDGWLFRQARGQGRPYAPPGKAGGPQDLEE